MSYLPTICDGCARVSLVRFSGCGQTAPDCSDCGGTRHVVPSCAYTQYDVALFHEVSRLVNDGLPPLEAESSGIEAGRGLLSGAFSETLDALSLRFPALIPLVLVASQNADRQRRLLLMLKTIFEAVALTRRSSTVALAPHPVPRADGG